MAMRDEQYGPAWDWQCARPAGHDGGHVLERDDDDDSESDGW